MASAWGGAWGASWGNSWGTIATEQPSGGWEDHPYLKPPPRYEEEDREKTPEVVSPVIEVKVDRRRKPKIEKPKERDVRVDTTEQFRELFKEVYIHEAASDMTEAELKRKRRNAAITLLLLH